MQSEDESGSALCRAGDKGGEFCSLHSDPGRAPELGRKVSTLHCMWAEIPSKSGKCEKELTRKRR
jgi:hypothetical protein